MTSASTDPGLVFAFPSAAAGLVREVEPSAADPPRFFGLMQNPSRKSGGFRLTKVGH
jgi:hypothetical protein